jgi:hypothetical protein
MSKRFFAVLAGLVLWPQVAFVPSAQATGAGACTISGTINFTSSPLTPTQGAWNIEPAVIQCYGQFRPWGRMLGPGSFAGSGVYATPPTASGAASGACAPHIGSGTVDYMIPTSEQDVHLIEPQSFFMAGAGSFTTPTLKGIFQVGPINDGDEGCLAQPVSDAVFLAQVVLLRPPSTAAFR